MDSTAGDLNHAAQEIELNEKEQNTHIQEHKSFSDKDAIGEKKELNTRSSGSSSQDDTALAKSDPNVVKIGEVKFGEEAYAHLPDDEKEIVKRQLHLPTTKVNYTTLFRYATRNDILIIVISSICAIAGGAAMPLMTVSSTIVITTSTRSLICTYRLSSVS